MLRLPHKIEDLRTALSEQGFTLNELIAEILNRRTSIRAHRDHHAHERCWLNDYFYIFALLEFTPEAPTEFNPVEMMRECKDFSTAQRIGVDDNPPAQPETAILDRANWDKDLEACDYDHLVEKLLDIQHAAWTFFSIWFLKPKAHLFVTPEDYQELYDNALPEKIRADFRLPPEEEFLGQPTPLEGCLNFLHSHLHCQSEQHNFNTWVPCTVAPPSTPPPSAPAQDGPTTAPSDE